MGQTGKPGKVFFGFVFILLGFSSCLCFFISRTKETVMGKLGLSWILLENRQRGNSLWAGRNNTLLLQRSWQGERGSWIG